MSIIGYKASQFLFKGKFMLFPFDVMFDSIVTKQQRTYYVWENVTNATFHCQMNYYQLLI